MSEISLFPGINFKESKFDFTLTELDSILYGYSRGDEQNHGAGVAFALSGLNINDRPHKDDQSYKAKYIDSIKKIKVPEGLALRHATISNILHCGVFCDTTLIPKGSKFGPLKGKLRNSLETLGSKNPENSWEIFTPDSVQIQFLDQDFDPSQDQTGNSGEPSPFQWINFVKHARYAQEQNVICFQEEGSQHLFYETSRDITQGTELLVWYSEDHYDTYLGLPLGLTPKAIPKSADPTWQERSEGFQCVHCEKVFAYKYYLDKHLKYTRCVDQGDRKFPCHLCTRSFEKKDRLRIHVLHVHDKHRPHKCYVCGKSFSQSSSLNKHIRVHSGERPYKCVYCSKAFTASSILRTHMRQHSGEKPFKCKFCGKAFASHAAHDSHVRRNHPMTSSQEFKAPNERSPSQTPQKSLHQNNPQFINGHNLDQIKGPPTKNEKPTPKNQQQQQQQQSFNNNNNKSLTNPFYCFPNYFNGSPLNPNPLNIYKNGGPSFFPNARPG